MTVRTPFNENDVLIDQPRDNHQTWNDCPNCGLAWKDDEPTPGLLHRTRLCASCECHQKGGIYET